MYSCRLKLAIPVVTSESWRFWKKVRIGVCLYHWAISPIDCVEILGRFNDVVRVPVLTTAYSSQHPYLQQSAASVCPCFASPVMYAAKPAFEAKYLRRIPVAFLQNFWKIKRAWKMDLVLLCTACAASRNGDAWNVFVTGASALVGFLFLAAAVVLLVLRWGNKAATSKE